MRWPWVFPVLLASGVASARTPTSAPPPAPEVNFWRDLIEPHADEVNAILDKVRELLVRVDHPLNGNDTEWAVDHRQRFYRDAKNLLTYARQRSPSHVEVLTLLGRVSDELGTADDAIEALESAARASGPDKIPLEVAGRLGAIYLRRGDRDTAIRWLKLAQGPMSLVTVTPIINLASALAAGGDSTKAIDLLATAIPSSLLGSYSNDITLATFALAVLYDRDEQRASAFAVLDQMQSGLQQQYATYVGNELARMRLAQPEDVHYYRGLLYESLGQYTEARAEWALYAAAGDTPWRARALAHVVAIDAQRRAHPGAPPQPAALTPQPQPTRPYHRPRTP